MATNEELASLFGALNDAQSGATNNSIGDLDTFGKSIAENDIYRQIADPLGSAKFDTRTWTPMESFGVSAGQSFLSSILRTLGQQNESEQLMKTASVLPQLYKDPSSVVAPEGVDLGAFTNLKMKSMVRNEAQQNASKTDMIKLLMGAKLAGMTAAEQAQGKVLGENAAWNASAGGISGAINPDSPQGKLQKQLQGLEGDTFNRITNNIPQYKLYSDVESNFNALQDIAKQDSKAADIALISTIARIRDPNSTVREGEYNLNAETQAYLDQVAGNWKQVVGGGSRLLPIDKAKIIASVVPKYNELGKSYMDARDPLLDALKAQGGDPSHIPTLEHKPFDTSTLLEPGMFTDGVDFIKKAQSLGLSRETAKARWIALGGQP